MEQLIQSIKHRYKEDTQLAQGPEPGGFSHTEDGTRVELYARAKLPTRHGQFTIFAFKNSKESLDHVAVVKGDIWNGEPVPMRLHSECLTGDVFGSLKCDCRDQLEKAIEDIGLEERGFILYMRQEGRGIGLANKIRAYSLQDRGLDTVEANLHLGFDDDMREYSIAAEMIKLLTSSPLLLMTNNPNKENGLLACGVKIAGRQAIQCAPNKHNLRYLKTKRTKSGHFLSLIP